MDPNLIYADGPGELEAFVAQKSNALRSPSKSPKVEDTSVESSRDSRTTSFRFSLSHCPFETSENIHASKRNTIMKAQIVSFHCVMKDSLGKVISSSFNQDVITVAPDSQPTSHAQNLRGLIEALQGVHTGEKKKFLMPAIDAYGLYDPKLVLVIARSELPKHLNARIGAEVPMNGRAYRIIRMDAKGVTVDGNHFLAGQDIYCDLEVVEAREAEPDDFDAPMVTPDQRYLH